METKNEAEHNSSKIKIIKQQHCKNAPQHSPQSKPSNLEQEKRKQQQSKTSNESTGTFKNNCHSKQ
jgi:hypothetical protein